MIRRCAGAALLLGVALAATGLSGGCEEPQPAPAPPPGDVAPATTPATKPMPATAPATQPVSSVMNIGGHASVFPPARLRLETDGLHLIALLFSDDPRDALKDNYTGNSFYLRMELDIDDPAKLADATWQYATRSTSEREDSPYGIYLGGRKVRLSPFQVTGRFKVNQGEPTGVTSVLFSGQFIIVDESTRRGPAQVVLVAAEMPVKVDSDLRQVERREE